MCLHKNNKGRVASGILKVGDEVELQPEGIKSEVKSIEMYHTNREVALPGDVVAFKYLPFISILQLSFSQLTFFFHSNFSLLTCN